MEARIALGTYPTRVARLEPLEETAGVALWVKRDDETSAIYGGNKVRKLEFILADARAKGKKRLVTVGAVGSHHVLATSVFGAQMGFEVEAVLVPQPRTDHVARNLRADLARGLHAFAVGGYAMVPTTVVTRLGRDSYFVTVGGSSATGSLGYVEAAKELAVQVRAGQMPEPDVIVVALGSGGTVAGLAAGLELVGMKTKVAAVVVSAPMSAVALLARRLTRKIARLVGADPGAAAGRIVVEKGYLGQGYGYDTPWGLEASLRAAKVGLTLDPTYTAKAFAHALHLSREASAGTILYWHTLSSAPFAPLMEGAPAEAEIDPRLTSLLR